MDKKKEKKYSGPGELLTPYEMKQLNAPLSKGGHVRKGHQK